MLIDRTAIEGMLPHRPPILLLQAVWVDEPGDAGHAVAHLPGPAPMLDAGDAGAWSQELSLEAAAQALGVVLGSAPATGPRPAGQHLLLGFDQVEFGPVPRADARLYLRVRREEGHAGACSASFSVRTAAHPVAHGRVMVMGGA